MINEVKKTKNDLVRPFFHWIGFLMHLLNKDIHTNIKTYSNPKLPNALLQAFKKGFCSRANSQKPECLSVLERINKESNFSTGRR